MQKRRQLSSLVNRSSRSDYYVHYENSDPQSRCYELLICSKDCVVFKTTSRHHAKGSAVVYSMGGSGGVGVVCSCNKIHPHQKDYGPIVATIESERSYKLERTEWGTICHNPLILADKGVGAYGWCREDSPVIFGTSVDDVLAKLKDEFVYEFINRAEAQL